jgi:TPR repeat protein
MDRKILRRLTLLLAVPMLSSTVIGSDEPSLESVEQVPDKRIVDCLLQGQIRKLGSTIYQSPPRPVSIPAIDCEIRGGDMLVFDRANFATSLAYWLGIAKGGDVNAQVYVGEIFERGLGRDPDYAQAAAWYSRAAEAGSPVAQISLAQLYEKGLGVTQDQAEAERLYALAFGADSVSTVVEIDTGSIDDPAEKIRLLEKSLQEAKNESAELSNQLQAAQINLTLAQQDLQEQVIEEQQLSENVAVAVTEAKTLSGAELQKANEDLVKSNAELEATQFAIAQLHQEVDRNERQLVAYQGEFNRIQELEQALQKQSQEYDAVNQELRRTRLDLAESNNKLAAQQNDIELERDSIQQARNVLRTENSMSEKSQQDLENRIRDREAKLASQESALADMRSEMESQSVQSRDLQNRLAELRKENDKLIQAQADADRYRLESNRLQIALSETQAQLNVIETAAASDELQTVRAEANLERYRNEAEEYKKRLDELEKELDKNIEMAGPSIQLVDPLAFVTRGTKSDVVVHSEARQQIVGKVLAPAGLLSLSVNDELTQVNDRNVFTTEIGIEGRETPVTIVAIDNQGKRAEHFYSLINEKFRPPQSGPVIEFGKFHALLIGNQEYEKLPDLQTPKNDIESIGAVLRDRYGYEITIIQDGTREQIMDGMYDLLATLDSEDNLLIYYAGHGEYVTDTNRGVWLPVDASPNSPANWITNVEINDYLKQIRAKQIVVIADSCYSGALTRSAIINLRPGLTDEEYEAHLKKMSKIRARVVLTSGGLAPVLDSATPGSKNSIFAGALLEILGQNEAILSAQDLGRTVAAKVSLAASLVGYEQEPQYAPLNHANHQGGDFFFVPVSL